MKSRHYCRRISHYSKNVSPVISSKIQKLVIKKRLIEKFKGIKLLGVQIC